MLYCTSNDYSRLKRERYGLRDDVRDVNKD